MNAALPGGPEHGRGGVSVWQDFLEVESGPRQLPGKGGLRWSFLLHWCSIGAPRMTARGWGDAFNHVHEVRRKHHTLETGYRQNYHVDAEHLTGVLHKNSKCS